MISKRSNTASAKKGWGADGAPARKDARMAFRQWLRTQPCACDGLNQSCTGRIHTDERPGGALPLSIECCLRRLEYGTQFELRYLPKPSSELAEFYRVKFAASLINAAMGNRIKDS